VLDVAGVVRETPDAVTLVLRDGTSREDTFSFLPGQFFTVLAEVDGEVVPRNYSASNAPGTSELHLTIKKKDGGRVSGAMCRTRAGDRLRVLGPFGSFVLEPRSVPRSRGAPRRLVLVAGGAGITPLASIARAVLTNESRAEIALVYANRRAEDIIFASELDKLALEHPNRLSVVHVLETDQGRLDRATTSRTLDAVPLASHPDSKFYVCGPDGMRDEVLAALAARNIREERIRIERFTIGPRPQPVPTSAMLAATVAPGTRPIAIHVKGDVYRTSALPGATILEAGLAAGAPMPFSCAVGGCGACRVKLEAGDVELDEPNCSSPEERAAGWVLACVGRPRGPCSVAVPEDS
jgi:ferredoxin-NADP reductase